jgi:hypothetical protein
MSPLTSGPAVIEAKQNASSLSKNANWFADNDFYKNTLQQLELYRFIALRRARDRRNEGAADIGNGGVFSIRFLILAGSSPSTSSWRPLHANATLPWTGAVSAGHAIRRAFRHRAGRFTTHPSLAALHAAYANLGRFMERAPAV